jgi:hypothetical protein
VPLQAAQARKADMMAAVARRTTVYSSIIFCPTFLALSLWHWPAEIASGKTMGYNA